MQSTQIQLRRFPQGEPVVDDFMVGHEELPELQENQVMVKNKWFSVDPYMRVRMHGERLGYLEPFMLRQPLEGHCVGQVVASRSSHFSVGSWVSGFKGWRDYFSCDAQELRLLGSDSDRFDYYKYLSVLGLTGMSAYIGLLKFGRPQSGDTVFVSAASGAVGSIVCQIAQLKGCEVIASAGRDDKIDWLREVLGIKKVINYKQEPIQSGVDRLAVDGLDVYFDNVGGDHLLAALSHMNDFGRIVMCGMISQYHQSAPAISINLFPVIAKRLQISGFLMTDYMGEYDVFEQEMRGWIESADIVAQESIVQGLSNAPQAFIEMMAGHHLGKVIVELD